MFSAGPRWRLLLAALAGAVVVGVSTDIQSINQAGTGREVLSDYYAKTMQDLADIQGGSTVHRFDPKVVFQHVLSNTQFFTGLMSVALVIPEPDRQTRSQHASTIEEVGPGVLMAAWFGGTWERMGDVGIWTARYEYGSWGKAKQIAWPVPSKQYPGWNAPCWNPVLKHIPEHNTTYFFFKVGVKPSAWEGYVMRSYDLGLTWGPPRKLGENIIGPVKNAPLVLSNGTILSPSSDEEGDWTSHVEVSHDNGWTWYRQPDIYYKRGIIQPAMFQTKDGNIRMLMRTHRDNTVASTVSTTGGSSWEEVSDINTEAPNSGLDAIALHDGRVVLIHNTEAGRKHLVMSMSYDNGETFEQVATLEHNLEQYLRPDECFNPDHPDEADTAEYSYPFLMQSSFDGMVHITYTYSYYGAGGRCTGRENIKHVVLDPCKLGDPLKAQTTCTTSKLQQASLEGNEMAEALPMGPTVGHCRYEDCNGEEVEQTWCLQSVDNCLGCQGVWCPTGPLGEDLRVPPPAESAAEVDLPGGGAGNKLADIAHYAPYLPATTSSSHTAVDASLAPSSPPREDTQPSKEIELQPAIEAAVAVSTETATAAADGTDRVDGQTVTVGSPSTYDLVSSMSFAVGAKPATMTLLLACLLIVFL